MNNPVRVLLIDDHTLVRSTLANWLREAGGIEIVEQSGDAAEGLDAALRTRPDVVIMDIDMPGLLCFDAARTIRARLPETRLIFLSAFTHDRYISDALSVEASGYLTKGEPPEGVVDAIRTVAGGGTWFSKEIQDRIIIDGEGVRLGGQNENSAVATRGRLLTRRETEVLRYIARGLSKKEIAATMHISVKTVDNHCTSVMAKLDIHDRVELARYAIREGLAEA